MLRTWSRQHQAFPTSGHQPVLGLDHGRYDLGVMLSPAPGRGYSWSSFWAPSGCSALVAAKHQVHIRGRAQGSHVGVTPVSTGGISRGQGCGQCSRAGVWPRPHWPASWGFPRSQRPLSRGPLSPGLGKQPWAGRALGQGLGSSGSWAANQARVWCRNWYCSAVWIMPPLRGEAHRP